MEDKISVSRRIFKKGDKKCIFLSCSIAKVELELKPEPVIWLELEQNFYKWIRSRTCFKRRGSGSIFVRRARGKRRKERGS